MIDNLSLLSDVRVALVINHLQGSFTEDISLDGLADVAGLSPNYLLYMFKKATGKTPHRYLTELRVAKSCDLLGNPRLSILQVAQAVGFSSQSHFITLFAQYMKITPASYRVQVLGIVTVRLSDACTCRSPEFSDIRIKRVVNYVQAHFDEEISLADLADIAGLSPNYLLNAFKKVTGKTPHRYLTELRVAKSCELLRNPKLSVVEVALNAGFSSQSHFTTVFGHHMKTTPVAYRNALG